MLSISKQDSNWNQYEYTYEHERNYSYRDDNLKNLYSQNDAQNVQDPIYDQVNLNNSSYLILSWVLNAYVESKSSLFSRIKDKIFGYDLDEDLEDKHILKNGILNKKLLISLVHLQNFF